MPPLDDNPGPERENPSPKRKRAGHPRARDSSPLVRESLLAPSLAGVFSLVPTRRQFLKLMGASLGLAGLTSCRWPKENIVPYARRPDNRMPGITVQYATAMELGGFAQGLLVTSYDGRPIKIEGNPLHPINRGATDVFAQASVLGLYDPDRSKVIVRREGARRDSRTSDRASRSSEERFTHSWDDFAAFARSHFAELRKRGGEGLCILSEATSSPSVIDMRGRLLKALPQAKWYEYEPVCRDNELAGATQAFGKPHRTHLRLDQARVLVCLDADILGTHPAAIKYARDFADARTADPLASGMSRLYAVESVYSITGGMADHRHAVRSKDIEAVALSLAVELANQGLEAFPVPGVHARAKNRAEDIPARLAEDGPARWGPRETGGEPDAGLVVRLVRDLLAHRGESLIAVGPRQPAVVHVMAHVLNGALGNVGQTVLHTAEPVEEGVVRGGAIGQLIGEMKAGKVGTVVILGGNPAFSGRGSTEFAAALGKVKTSIHLGLYEDETAELCVWHVNQSHYLESWGDARAYDGTVSLVQPLIDPLYEGKTPLELLALFAGDPVSTAYDIVRRTFTEQFAGGGDLEASWGKALHDGLVEGTAWALETPALRSGLDAELSAAAASAAPNGTGAHPDVARGEAAVGEFELVFVPDYRVHDGRFANNGWLQELPDPMTRLTWDNAAIVSPADAKKLGVRKSGAMLRVEAAGRSLEMPALILPGQASGSITLALGYGRRLAGGVGRGVGFDVNVLRSVGCGDIISGASVSGTGKKHRLVGIEDFHHIDLAGIRAKQERIGELVQEVTLAEYRADPAIIQRRTHRPAAAQLWRPHEYPEHKWGMAIDLTRCTGCSACVAACTAENNIPVVGKDQVSRGRIMQWVRADRYFHGDPESPRVTHQVVPCMHCEDAPCEQVCPVGATTHDAEGLNQQIYNRCVGTRYCSNNCPYKVRRFNWYHYQLAVPETVKMAFNPDVTVRSRGVMEKCTYCVQRIHAVRLKARLERRQIRDGEIVPACAQTCPTRAIVFGDLNDKESEVAKLHASNRAYAMLSELNVKPRTVYLARLRNPAVGEDEG